MDKYPLVRALATMVAIAFTSREEESFPFPCYFDRSTVSDTVNNCPKLQEVTADFDGNGLSPSACLQDDEILGDRVFSRVVADLKNMRGVNVVNLKYLPRFEQLTSNAIWTPPEPTVGEIRLDEWVAVEDDIAHCASRAPEGGA